MKKAFDYVTESLEWTKLVEKLHTLRLETERLLDIEVNSKLLSDDSRKFLCRIKRHLCDIKYGMIEA
jgi:hypothetical protein